MPGVGSAASSSAALTTRTGFTTPTVCQPAVPSRWKRRSRVDRRVHGLAAGTDDRTWTDLRDELTSPSDVTWRRGGSAGRCSCGDPTPLVYDERAQSRLRRSA